MTSTTMTPSFARAHPNAVRSLLVRRALRREAKRAGRTDGKDEVTVIGDEPGNTDSDPDPSEKAVS